MSDDPIGIASRLFNACLAILLGAMALWGAVAIIESVWVYLCVLAAAAAIGALIWWLVSKRYRGW